MKTPQTTVLRKEMTTLGVGLLETALEIEGGKGCSPLICAEPVALEPPYQSFDGEWVLSYARGTTAKNEAHVRAADTAPVRTFDVYAAVEDILSLGWMESMLRGISVLPGRFAFELFGGGGRVWVRFGVPHSQVAGFRAGLEGLFPGLCLRENENPFPSEAPVAVNELVPVPPYHRSLTLVGREGASPLGVAAGVISSLPPEARGTLQVVMTPADLDHDWHYNIQNLVEAELRAMRLSMLGGITSEFKYDERLPPLLERTVREKVEVDVALHATLVRYAVWNADPPAVEGFLQGMRVATGMVRFGNRAWRVLEDSDLRGLLGVEALSRMVAERLAHRPGVMLTSRELATLIHLPNERNLKMIAAIQQRTGIPWSPFAELDEGTVNLGTNVYAGREVAVSVPMEIRTRHTYIGGTTGYGKTAELETLAIQDAESGVGFCLIDPHGDLAFAVLSKLPEKRMKDLVWVSFSEAGLVPKWNPFRSDAPPGKLADDITRCFLAQTLAGGARMEHNFRMLAYTVHRLGGTLDDLAEMVSRSSHGDQLRREAIGTIGNRQVLRFLKNELPKYRDAELSSVRNKLSRLLTDESLGTMFSQPENAVAPRQWMDEGKVVLVNLASGELGADHVRFAGGLLVSLIYRAALGRADVAVSERRRFMLYLDEFQLLQTGTLSEILSEGRKFGLGAVLAHQERGQLSKELGQAVGNCMTRIVFRPSVDDLPYFAKALNGRVQPELLASLEIGQAVVACGARVATVETHLCDAPVVRDGRAAARAYAEEHYIPVAAVVRGSQESAAFRAMRELTYDRLGPEEDENSGEEP